MFYKSKMSMKNLFLFPSVFLFSFSSHGLIKKNNAVPVLGTQGIKVSKNIEVITLYFCKSVGLCGL